MNDLEDSEPQRQLDNHSQCNRYAMRDKSLDLVVPQKLYSDVHFCV